MDLNDAERYAVAALFTLALHSTQVETGVDKNGNSLSESDIAWGCPSEELFDEYLLSQVPLRLPAELQEVFWGFDCMAPAGLAPRLFAWLKIPRKAWPGLLRMPDLAGNAGSPAAVEAFVALVRRYSAFLDPELAFTTGQACRLQQHFTLPEAAAAAAAAGEDGTSPKQQQQQQLGDSTSGSSTTAAEAENAGTKTTTSSSSSTGLFGMKLFRPTNQLDDAATAASSSKPAAAAAAAEPVEGAADPSAAAPAAAAEAVAAAAASITAAAMAASRDSSEAGSAPAAAAAAGSSSSSGSDPRSQQQQDLIPAADPSAAAETAAEFAQLHSAVDKLPKTADEGTVVPAATFTPAEHYEHSTSHKAVLALYEIIGGCLRSNTESFMEPLFAAAAKEADAAAATAAGVAKKQQDGSSSAGGKPAAAWFPAGDSSSSSSLSDSPKAAKAASPPTAAPKQAAQQQQQQPGQIQGLAVAQWYDARARVAVKRVAHWLRVPWPQVRAFEQMWAAQALNIDPSTQPKYSSGSRAMQYLKVGAAAVGGGALLAVTGGLAAPAVAAGLGAAVTLAHGGAAAAAAVAGFAGSTAGTAAVTGLFGTWGASVAGGSAGRLFGEVTEFGFLDVGQSIYTDGRPLSRYDKPTESSSKVASSSGDTPSVQQQHQEEPSAPAGSSKPATPTTDAKQQQQRSASKSPTKLFGWPRQTQESEDSDHEGVDTAEAGYQQLDLQDDSTTTTSSTSRRNSTDAGDSDSGAGQQHLTAAAAAAKGPQQQQQQQASVVQQLQKQPTNEHPLQADWEPDWGPGEQQQQQQDLQQQQQQQPGAPQAVMAGPSSSSSSKISNQEPAGSGGSIKSATSSPSAAAAAGPAAGTGSSISSWFTRKPAAAAAAQPTYVPLLSTPINPKHSVDTRMALTIAVNGCCISCTEDYVRPWINLPSRDCDRMALIWESLCLKELGGALVSFLAQQALTQVTQKTIQTFLYTGLIGALALPMTLTTAMKVAFGSKWLVALRRAQVAGKMLAMQLLQGCHGGRPVTLIGCSMGARLVFHCLLELSRLGARGCIESVILLGAPLSCRPDRWCAARSVVAGRLINGYSVNDWTLGLLYRVHSSNSLWTQAAGIWKVDVPGVENVNLSRLINGHSDYLAAMDDILDVINMHDT